MAGRFESFELEGFADGHRVVAGIDEAGRGALAGPLTVGLAVFKKEIFAGDLPPELASVNDSKKLTPIEREKHLLAIRTHAAFCAVVHMNNRIVDSLGINPATERAMICACRRAERAGMSPDLILIDGNYKFKALRAAFPDAIFRSVVKGDSRIFSIAAASILAKVVRDRRMQRFAPLFPAYEFEVHKGYGTELHMKRVREHGASSLHRKSFLRKEEQARREEQCEFFPR